MTRIVCLLLTLALLLGFSGCAAPAPESSQSLPTAPAALPAQPSPAPLSEGTEPASHYPVTVTDMAGREVVIEQQPETLVSGYYISTSALIALGADDKLVGIEAKAASRPIYALSAPQLLELPSVGTAKSFDLEGCAALEPDLVFLPAKLAQAADTLTQLGIPVLLVNPENQELLNQMLTLMGTALDLEPQAQALLDYTQSQQEYLAAALSGVEAPRVYLAGNSDLLSTAGEAMYQSSLIRMAGCTNVAAALTDSYWVSVSYEQLLAWDPEFIILASDAAYTVEDVMKDPSLAPCQAVKNGNVFRMPGAAEAWDSPVPGGVLGALWLASLTHPEQIPDGTWQAQANGYYETFYGAAYPEG